jgi:predicted Fe-S protein YdhL (DUF1289 family)
MNGSPHARWRLALFAAGLLAVFPAPAGNSTNVPAPMTLLSAPANANEPSPLPQPRSPVDYFRQLLAMSPDDRAHLLTNRPPEIRERILAKVNEYLALDPNERELRLRATELRWYLMPLLRASPTNRAALLAQVPDDLRELVQGRLDEWTILPPPLQQEFLDNERALRYFTHVDLTNVPPPALENGGSSGPSGDEWARWNSLSEIERTTVIAQFKQFFELTPDEKQKTLNTLSAAEQQQMAKTLQSFGKLPPDQRDECIHAFAKFESMSAPERAEFLKNAARWSQMSPNERQTWRDLVEHVPEWPPLPTDFLKPPPPENFPAVAATNHG